VTRIRILKIFKGQENTLWFYGNAYWTTEYFHGIGKYYGRTNSQPLAMRRAIYALTITCYCLDNFQCEKMAKSSITLEFWTKFPRITTKYCLDCFHREKIGERLNNFWNFKKFITFYFFNHSGWDWKRNYLTVPYFTLYKKASF
jgi:hypothetical protein